MDQNDPFSAIAQPPVASPKPQSGAQDDPFAAIAQPAPASQDSPTSKHPILDKIQNTFDRDTAVNPSMPRLQVGINRALGAIGSPIVHPLNTLAAMSHMSPTDPENPIAQRGAEAVDDYKNGGLGYAATKLAGDAAGMFLGGDVAKPVTEAAGRAVGAVREGVQGAYDAHLGNPAPNYVSPAEQNVRGMVKSLNLPVNYVEPLVQDLMGPNKDGATAGVIRHYEAKGGKPMTGPLDASKLATQAGDDLRAHFITTIRPIEDETMSIVGSGSPADFGKDGRASVREVDNRLIDINKQLDQAYAAEANGNPSPIAKAPLEAEAKALRGKLYDAIAVHTGIPQGEIQSLREGYGKLYSASSTLTRAADAAAKSSTTFPKSIPEAAAKITDHFHGGPEGALNRRFRNSLNPIQPQEPNLPTSPAPNPDAVAAAEAQRAAAQQQFLHAHSLEQSAQDAAAQRSQQAEGMRQGIATGARQRAVGEFLHANSLENMAQDASTARADQAAQLRQGISSGAQQGAVQEFTHANSIEQAAQDAANQRANQAALIRQQRRMAEIAKNRSAHPNAPQLPPNHPLMRPKP